HGRSVERLLPRSAGPSSGTRWACSGSRSSAPSARRSYYGAWSTEAVTRACDATLRSVEYVREVHGLVGNGCFHLVRLLSVQQDTHLDSRRIGVRIHDAEQHAVIGREFHGLLERQFRLRRFGGKELDHRLAREFVVRENPIRGGHHL